MTTIFSPKADAEAAGKVVDQAGQVAGKVGQDLIDHVGEDTPGIVERVLDALAKFEFCFSIRRKT